MKRLLILFIILILPLCYAIDECKGTALIQENIPCYVLLTVDQTATACNTIEVGFYNESTNIYNQTMGIYNPFKCNATFNQTGAGTYSFQYSAGTFIDTGSITVEGGRMIELLLYFAVGIAFLLLIIGLYIQDRTCLNLSGLLFMVCGIFIGLNGFSALNNILTNGIAAILIGFGFFIMFKANFEE